MANRYWVGGTGSWNSTNTTNWSATSGGAGGASAPGASDDVFFDANSGTGTVTVAQWIGVKSLTCTGYSGTITSTTSLSVYGNITLSSTMTWNFGANYSDLYISGPATVITAGKVLNHNIYVGGGVGSTVTQGDAMNCQGTISGLGGGYATFDTAGYALIVGRFYSNYPSFTVYLRNSAVTCIGSDTDFFTEYWGTKYPGTATITCTGNIGMGGGWNNFSDNTIIMQGGGTIYNGANIKNLVIDQSGFGAFGPKIAGNITINGTLSEQNTTYNRRSRLISNTEGVSRTMTVNAMTLTYTDFQDITIAGAAAGTTVANGGDRGNNTGITFPAPKTVYWNYSGTGLLEPWWDYRTTGYVDPGETVGWASTSGGTPALANFPLPQDTGIVNNTSQGTGWDFSASSRNYSYGNLDLSSRTNAFTFNMSVFQPVFMGDLKLGSGCNGYTYSGLKFIFNGYNRTQTIQFGSLPVSLTIQISSRGTTGKVALGSALTTTAPIWHVSGGFDTNGYTLTVPNYVGTWSTSRNIDLKTSTVYLNGTGEIWQVYYTNITLADTAHEIILSSNSTAARTFRGNGLKYNKITIGGTATSQTNIYGSNTIKTLASTKTVAHTLRFEAGTTNTFTTWSVTGTSGNVVTVGSLSTAAVTLRKPTQWKVGANSTDAGNNSGLSFTSGDSIDYLNISYVNASIYPLPLAGKFLLIF